MSLTSVPVLHIIDSLKIGGAERVAVNIANALPSERYQSHLCVTRDDGPLRAIISPHIKLLFLNRRGRFDAKAVYQLINYTRRYKVRIIHAHSSSLFIALAIKMFVPSVKLIWHIHLGAFAERTRGLIPYRIAAHWIDSVVAVSEPLALWACAQLQLPADIVTYLPNFPLFLGSSISDTSQLPGTPNSRIVIIANIRPEKDHLTLVKSMTLVVNTFPAAHLLIIGSLADSTVVEVLRAEINRLSLQSHISILGERHDIGSILSVCAIGVLNSKFEGFPLALIEYGSAGLAVVATNVGQCPDILSHGNTGILIPSGNVQALANAILFLLQDPQQRFEYGQKFLNRVRDHYSKDIIIQKLLSLYDKAIFLSG